MTPKTPMGQLWDAISAGDRTEVRRLTESDPALLGKKPPFAGGTWLHLAARWGNQGIVQMLVERGLSVDEPATLHGDLALVSAAHGGKLEAARYLLDQGSPMDTSASVRNPLFAAIVGQSPEVVRLLLERGIDATVRYSSETMTDMDATAFALWRGETELARIIALHLAGGNEVKAQALLSAAQEVVSCNAPLQNVRLVPSMEDLERE
jgi:hypothetical protein